jgi:hypothetical protein
MLLEWLLGIDLGTDLSLGLRSGRGYRLLLLLSLLRLGLLRVEHLNLWLMLRL